MFDITDDNRFKKEFFLQLQKRSFENFNETAYEAIPVNIKNFIWSCYWYPLKKIKDDIHVIAFEADFFDDGVYLNLLRDILISHGVSRVTVVPELDHVYVIENFKETILDIDEDGAYDLPHHSEQFIFDKSKDWMIYTSHEATITFAGEWLVSEIKKCIKDWEKHEIKN